MAMKSPRKLPRTFNRPVSRYTRTLVKKRRTKQNVRKRQQVVSFWRRRTMKIGKVVVSELKLWGIIIATGVVLLGIGILVFSPLFDVKQIRVVREDTRLDSEEIQRTLSPLFSQRLFLVTRGEVENLLQSAFADIESVSIDKTYPSTLEVSLELDPLIAKLVIAGEAPVQTVSGSLLPTASGGYTYLTAKGYTVLSPVELSDGPMPLIKVLDWAIRPEHRSHLLDVSFIDTLFDARDELEEFFGTQVTAITVYVRANEFHMQNQGKSFWFDAATPLEEQFARLREFLRAVDLNQVKRYVDLRLADKVVFQ